jgi:hypothetical protein
MTYRCEPRSLELPPLYAPREPSREESGSPTNALTGRATPPGGGRSAGAWARAVASGGALVSEPETPRGARGQAVDL